MKKWVKVILGVIGIIVLLFIIDLICIFRLKKPLFAIKEDNGDSVNLVYKGLLYDTYICHEDSSPQIKQKGAKFNCSTGKEYIGKVIEIKDTTKDIKDFACAEALEQFYKDDQYTYYWECIKNNYMIVKYESGYEGPVSEALKTGAITISDLDDYNIFYIKEEIGITLDNVNTIIQEYFGKENVDRTNLGYNYIDEENNVVVVGLIDNSKEKQDEFIYNVFSSCCGSMYIEYIKDNNMIEFRKTDRITTSNNNE